jgi:hypothetical protein
MSSFARRGFMRNLGCLLTGFSAFTTRIAFASNNNATFYHDVRIVNTHMLSINLHYLFRSFISAEHYTPLNMIGPFRGTAEVYFDGPSPIIAYRPPLGFQGADEIWVRFIADGAPYTLRIGVVVLPPIDVPVPTDPIRVANAAELRLALGRVRPGETILLADGTYEGDFTASRAGTAAAPIVIQCARILGATVTGKFTVAAADVTLLGLVVRRGIVLTRDRAKASRCRVDGSGTDSAVEVAAGRGAVVEFCDLTNFASQAVRVLGPARSPRIYRNHVHDQAPPPNPLDVAAMIAGTGKATSAVEIGAHFLENLVERTEGRQTIELKSSANIVEGNTSIGTNQRAGDLLVRHGLDNVFLRNWVESGRLLVGDERTVAVRNLCTGAHGPCVGVKAGTLTGDDLRRGQSGYPISENARLVANEAVVELGWRYGWNRKPVGTRIEAHDEGRWAIRRTLVDPGEVSISAATDYGPLPAAPRKLTAAAVGPFAGSGAAAGAEPRRVRSPLRRGGAGS